MANYTSAFPILLLACGSEPIIDDSCFVDLTPISALGSGDGMRYRQRVVVATARRWLGAIGL